MKPGKDVKTVVYTCPFVPAEWIAAHGLAPRRIVPGAGSGALLSAAVEGLCPFAGAFAEEVFRGSSTDAAVFSTACDQMRRVMELFPRRKETPPVFLLNVPHTWEEPGALRLYRSELIRLGRFLCGIGGIAPSAERLAGEMLRFDTARAALRAARGILPPPRFAEALARFHETGGAEPPRPGEKTGEKEPRKIPVALVGAPLLARHFALFDLVGEEGGRVVLDGTGTGERTLLPPFDRRTLRGDPFGLLAETYFTGIPDAFRRPNSALYAWLGRAFEDRGIRGVLFFRHTFCDTWHVEYRRLKEWCNLPMLEIESGSMTPVDGRTRSRIQSFLEVLS